MVSADKVTRGIYFPSSSSASSDGQAGRMRADAPEVAHPDPQLYTTNRFLHDRVSGDDYRVRRDGPQAVPDAADLPHSTPKQALNRCRKQIDRPYVWSGNLAGEAVLRYNEGSSLTTMGL